MFEIKSVNYFTRVYVNLWISLAILRNENIESRLFVQCCQIGAKSAKLALFRFSWRFYFSWGAWRFYASKYLKIRAFFHKILLSKLIRKHYIKHGWVKKIIVFEFFGKLFVNKNGIKSKNYGGHPCGRFFSKILFSNWRFLIFFLFLRAFLRAFRLKVGAFWPVQSGNTGWLWLFISNYRNQFGITDFE